MPETETRLPTGRRPSLGRRVSITASRKSAKLLRRLSSFFESYESKIKVLNAKRESSELVPEVRERFLERYDDHKEDYDEVDVQRVRNNDWAVERFVKFCKDDADKALEMLDTALKWRKSYGVNIRKEEDCPIEFFQIGALFPYHEDKEGNIMVYMRCKASKKVKELREFIQQFLIGVIDRVDQVTNGHGYVLVFDLNAAGMSNVDMDLLQFLITSLRDYYPLGIKYILVYNLPWILKPVWAMVKPWLGDLNKMAKFASGNELFNYVDKENLPKYYGGTCNTDFTAAPRGCKPVEELAHLHGFTKEDIRKYMKVYESLLEEAKTIMTK